MDKMNGPLDSESLSENSHRLTAAGERILPTRISRFERLNQLAGAPVCDRLLTLANPKAGYKPALQFKEAAPLDRTAY